MTKRIVSGIFILTALGALGVILAGALTSGEQLIVRFLTAVIVAALGLYVISDLRLQADDDAITARSSGSGGSRVNTVDVPPNSTAAFMATVTKRGDKDDEAALNGSDDATDDKRVAVGVGDDAETAEREPATASTNGSSANGSAANGSAVNGSAVNGSAVNGSAVNGTSDNGNASGDRADQDTRADGQKVEVGATASSTTEVASAAVEAAGSGNGSEVGLAANSVSTKAPATVRAIDISPPKDIALVNVVPAQMNGIEQHDEAGQVDAGGPAGSDDPPIATNGSGSKGTGSKGTGSNGTSNGSGGGNNGWGEPTGEPSLNGAASGNDSSAGSPAADTPPVAFPAADSDVTAEMQHSAIFEQARKAASLGADPLETPAANDAVPNDSVSNDDESNDDSTAAGAEEAVVSSDFEYSDELQSPEHEWPSPPAKPIEPVVEQPHPFEKASAAYQAEKDRLAAEAGTSSLPVPAAPQELEAADYADAPLAPIIDLRDASGQNPGTVDAAINAGEVEVIATLIEQGMLSTDGPISDRDVRTMVYVAFTSNELRKLLLAGGTPDGPNYGLDLGPVELFDEKVHAPAPKTLYSGIPRRQPQSQIG